MKMRNQPVLSETARLLLALAASVVFLAPLAPAQSIPATRPRARPPSALTGRADNYVALLS